MTKLTPAPALAAANRNSVARCDTRLPLRTPAAGWHRWARHSNPRGICGLTEDQSTYLLTINQIVYYRADRMVAATNIVATQSPAEAMLDRVFAALADPLRRGVLNRPHGKKMLVSGLA